MLATALGCRDALCRQQSGLAREQVIFRAGVWKPRTSPESFQGAGDEALGWLQQAQEQSGLPIATEVATPEHVEKALAAGIRQLWIGARTSANPIAVQAIADTIRTTTTGDGLTIFVKNPVNEDVKLWIGNIERIEKALGSSATGQGKVLAIHRGCGHKPCWAMAFELRRQRPDIPLLLDPSHLSGDASKIGELCQTAKELDFDGVMIEVHPQPETALSDSQQQITPQQLAEIASRLRTSENDTAAMQLKELRKEIDEVDDALWEMIEKRMNISRRIGAYKKQQAMEVVQPNRFEQILQRRITWAETHGLSEEAVRQIFEAIHKESVRVQS